jgi:hypothetical protein
MDVNNLPRFDTIVIALLLSGSAGLPFFLSIGLMTPIVHVYTLMTPIVHVYTLMTPIVHAVGIIPESKTTLNSVTYKGII